MPAEVDLVAASDDIVVVRHARSVSAVATVLDAREGRVLRTANFPHVAFVLGKRVLYQRNLDDWLRIADPVSGADAELLRPRRFESEEGSCHCVDFTRWIGGKLLIGSGRQLDAFKIDSLSSD